MNVATKPPSRDKRKFSEALKSARLGQPDAQYEVGLMYANGVGVAQDISQAVEWITQAAKRGLARAQYLLATRYETGTGVEPSAALAMLWHGRAAEQGHAKSVLRLGKVLSQTHLDGAVQQFQSAALLGLAEGQYALAKAYAEGLGIERDQTAAARWFRAAAEQGLSSAQFALADLLINDHGEQNFLDEALIWYRRAAAQGHLAAKVAIELLERAGHIPTRGNTRTRRKFSGAERRRDEVRWLRVAENGNADAKYHMGLMYELGLGLEANLDNAKRWYRASAQWDHTLAQAALAKILERQGSADSVEWYKRSAEKGEPDAQFALGRLFCNGELTPQDYLKGLHWYVRAADQGHTMAMVTLGKLCNLDMHHVAASYFVKAAEAGLAEAQYLLGQQYANGRGVARNFTAAFECYEKAAQQGLAAAESELGVAWLNGQGVDRDLQHALYWLQRAAAQGDAQAQWNLGAIFASGRPGLPRDLKRAFALCLSAAKQGFVAAQANMGALYALLKDPEKAAAWWGKAAAQDDPEALYNLAIAHLNGRGVSKDVPKGFELLWRAASQGVVAAQSKLGLMYAKGDGVALDPIEAHKWFLIAAGRGDEIARTNLVHSEALCSAVQVAEGVRRASQWEAGRTKI